MKKYANKPTDATLFTSINKKFKTRSIKTLILVKFLINF